MMDSHLFDMNKTYNFGEGTSIDLKKMLAKDINLKKSWGAIDDLLGARPSKSLYDLSK